MPDELAGERLDKALASLFPAYSRTCLQSWIKAGRVWMNGMPASVRQPALRAAQVVVQPTERPLSGALTAEAVPLDIVYEDDALLVINKPAGLVVHPGAGNWQGTVLNGLLHRYGDAAAQLPRAGIVHRLDKHTSGLMVIARTLAAQTNLVRQLQAHAVKRCYLALVWGKPSAYGIIDAPIGRDPYNRLRMAVVHGATGRPARTHYRTIAVNSEASEQPIAAVQCDLETGRTHQIRVHFTHLRHSLVGDPLYGKTRKPRNAIASPASLLITGFERQALHAARLELTHPLTGKVCRWHAAVPTDLATLAGALQLPLTLME